MFKSPRRLEVENLVLRHQLIVLRRHNGGGRVASQGAVFMADLVCRLLGSSRVIRPETIVRWHRAGFRAYWCWKSRLVTGRPKISRELREFIRRMNIENPLWGAPRIHGELLKLGFDVAQSSVAKYMVKQGGPPGQGWRTFLRNHAAEIAAMDLFVVPTLTSVPVCLRDRSAGRRDLIWTTVTRHPTAEWLAQQIIEAFPWGTAPRYLVRDEMVLRTSLHGLRENDGHPGQPIAPASPWQNVL